jgi:predicted ribosomally synthesized peptide with SipW-like signal peptide
MTAAILIIVGFSLGAVSYYSDTSQYNNLVTVGSGSQQTVVNLETQQTVYTILIFVSGAIFSAGFSMLFAFPEFDKTGHIKGG